MFGKNILMAKVNDPYQLAVHSAFYTIQGEGPFSGQPALFVRLAGCNLACHFCDTEFEAGQDDPVSMTHIMGNLLSDFTRAQRKLVVLTGGEPLRQNPTLLIRNLLESGTDIVQIETAGTVWPDGMDQLIDAGRVVLVCSPKTPKVHAAIQARCVHWKYVVTAGQLSQNDGLPNRGTQPATKDIEQILARPQFPGTKIWVSPCDLQDPELNKANQAAAVASCLKFGYTLNLQIHKIVGLE